MADNRHKYGFRFYATQSGAQRPAAFEGIIASAYAGDVGGSVGVSIGDPVVRLADGTYELAQDTNTSDRLYGVIVGIRGKVDANGKARPCSYLPSGTTYALEETTSKVMIVPFSNHIWEIDHTGGAATTLAAYRALMGLNADFAYSRDTSNADKPRANPVIDLATADTTAALQFRLVDVSKTQENQDFSGANVKLLVQLNQGADPMLGTTGVAGL
jgi:hypothetical protein